MAEDQEYDILDEPASYEGGGDVLDLGYQEAAPLESARPTWGSAAMRELYDMYMGIAHLGETAVLQGANLFPEADPTTHLGAAQRLAPERLEQDIEGLKKAPMQMLRSLGETFLGLVPGSDYSIYEKLKYQPVQTVSDLMTPLSAVSGLAKAGGKVAAIAGKTGTAKASHRRWGDSCPHKSCQGWGPAA
jgi:hypothetical protein